jgi:hypothetical protein
MSSRLAPPKEPPKAEHVSRRAPPPADATARFDKAFPVWLEGESGIASGVGRNITATGMFVETREPFGLGSRVRATFVAPGGGGVEMIIEGEVRYQCFINFARADATRAGLRGIGLRFVAPVEGAARKGVTVH